jgi:hypothetical protein
MPTVEEVIKKYVATRDEIAKKTAALEAELKPLKEFQEAREAFLQGELTKLGAKNISTKEGTAMFNTQEFVRVSDWDSFVDKVFLKPVMDMLYDKYMEFETGAEYETFLLDLKDSLPLELLNHAVNKTAVLEIMGAKRENPAPHGISYTSKRVVQVRR